MPGADETDDCGTCGASVAFPDARRSTTYGGLDPDARQTPDCPRRGARPATVFVGDK